MRPRTLDELVGQPQLRAAGLAAAPADRGRPVDVAAAVGPAGHRQDHDRRDRQPADRPARSSRSRRSRPGSRRCGPRSTRPARDLTRRGRETVLFVDEVHRFSKAQQDALLPGVENRWVTLVAATTENPFFSVISPLLSRSLLLQLELAHRRRHRARCSTGRWPTSAGWPARSRLDDDALDHLVRLAGGDARRSLTYLEAAAGAASTPGPRRRSTWRPPRPPSTGPRCATTGRATSTTT